MRYSKSPARNYRQTLERSLQSEQNRSYNQEQIQSRYEPQEQDSRISNHNSSLNNTARKNSTTDSLFGNTKERESYTYSRQQNPVSTIREEPAEHEESSSRLQTQPRDNGFTHTVVSQTSTGPDGKGYTFEKTNITLHGHEGLTDRERAKLKDQVEQQI
jgi:hypothetical protein